MAKRSADEISNFFEHGVDITHRTIYLGSPGYDEDDEGLGVDFFMTEKFIKALHILDLSAPSKDKPIHILMNNPGGSCVDGMAIYDAIKACKNHITVTVFGEACSMGCIILQAADERILSPHSIVMFHEGYASYGYNHPEIIRKWVKFDEKYKVLLDNIVMNRIKEKHVDFKDKKFREMNLFDTILTAQEAIDLGLADKILDD